MRNPRWHRDELILALDLYFKKDRGSIDARNPEVVQLSRILNKLPIHKIRPDEKKFRNPNGVSLKLSNFLAIDPNYEGEGMSRGGKQDKDVFQEFHNNRDLLRKIANQIKETVQDEELSHKLYYVPDEEDEEVSSVMEGTVLYKLHRYRERDRKISKKKKELTLKEFGKLKCEVCGFDFKEIYGELGKGYIECHHIKPLSEARQKVNTRLEDLALVCSNCHRMLHRKLDSIGVEKLKLILKGT